LEIGKVSRDAEQNEIDFAREHVTGAHLRPGAHLLFKCPKICLRLAGEPDKGKGGHLETERLRVQVSVVALDVPRLFEGAYAPQTWGSRDVDAVGQLDIGHAAVGLQFGEDLAVNGVETMPSHATPRATIERN
jgi:hypothetical protein